MGNMSGSYGSHYTIWIEIKTNKQTASSNSSNVTCNLYLTFDGSGYYATQYNTTPGNMVVIWDNQEKVNESYTIPQIVFASGQKKDILLASWTGNIPHDSSGNRKITVSGSWDTQTSRIGSGVSTITDYELKQIKRYPTFTTQPYVTSRGLQSLTFSYGEVDMASSIYYSLDNKNWNPIYAQTTKISDLEPNTKYTIYVRARNQQDTSLYTTKSFSATTLDIARITDAPNIDVGNNPTISFTNPSGSKITLYAVAKLGDSSIVISDKIDVTGLTSYTLPLYHDTIYQTFTETNTANIRYAIKTETGAYLQWVDRIGNIKNSNPIFEDFVYQDTNSKVVNLTNNNQTIILGHSNVSVTVPVENKAEAINYATMRNYKVLIGQENSKYIEYSENSDVTSESINQVKNNVISVYANDSRGNTTEVKKTATTIDYSDIKIKTLTAQRENNIGETVILEFVIDFWNGNFGAVNNGIDSLIYKFKKTEDDEYITGTTTLSYNIVDNQIVGSASIRGDSSSGGFEVDDTYDIQLLVNDKISHDDSSVILGTGNPALAVYKNKVAIGQGYDTSVGGALQVNGDTHLTGDIYLSTLQGDNKSVAEKINSGIIMKKLWSKTLAEIQAMGTFDSQSISLDLSPYKYVMISFYKNYTNTSAAVLTQVFKTGTAEEYNRGELFAVDYYNGVRSWTRAMNIKIDGITFFEGTLSGTTNNKYIVPFEIIGIA